MLSRKSFSFLTFDEGIRVVFQHTKLQRKLFYSCGEEIELGNKFWVLKFISLREGVLEVL